MAGLSLVIWFASPMLADALRGWSYAGAFILAFLSSATVFVPAGPLQLAIVMLGRQLDPVALGIVAGIGSGFGELSGYFVGQGSSHVLRTKDKTLKMVMKLQTGVLRRFAGPGVFLLAAVPNPIFDFAGIAAGLMGMKWHEFLFWCISGRILRFLILAYLGAWSLHWIG
jgi:membrane protein YqaA with SNARE-associated domain